MNNTLAPFKFEQKELRTLVIDGEPWFVGKDVATILGYKNIQLTTSQYKQVALMAGQFYQSSRKKEPRKIRSGNTMVNAYSNADLEYVNQAIRTV